jgi:hypothetical protein
MSGVPTQSSKRSAAWSQIQSAPSPSTLNLCAVSPSRSAHERQRGENTPISSIAAKANRAAGAGKRRWCHGSAGAGAAARR